MARDIGIQDEARADMLAACAKWIDQWDDFQGSIVTGFVVIVETLVGTDSPVLSFASGNGAATDDQAGGLARWRIDGMCREVSNEMAAIVFNWRRETGDTDGQ